MGRSINQQITLKPQDVMILLKLVSVRGRSFTYATLAWELSISASELHAGLKRCELARLVANSRSGQLHHSAVTEFILHGAKYSFPPTVGTISRGIATSHAGPSLKQFISQTSDMPFVWPSPDGDVRGVAVLPVYPSVPSAARNDPELYDLLTLFDALRVGAAREREFAFEMLERRCLESQ